MYVIIIQIHVCNGTFTPLGPSKLAIMIIEVVLISGVNLYNKGRLNVINTGVYLFQRVLNREVPLYTVCRENYMKEKFSEFGKNNTVHGSKFDIHKKE